MDCPNSKNEPDSPKKKKKPVNGTGRDETSKKGECRRFMKEGGKRLMMKMVGGQIERLMTRHILMMASDRELKKARRRAAADGTGSGRTGWNRCYWPAGWRRWMKRIEAKCREMKVKGRCVAGTLQSRATTTTNWSDQLIFLRWISPKLQPFHKQFDTFFPKKKKKEKKKLI